jgi:hypothetical protein
MNAEKQAPGNPDQDGALAALERAAWLARQTAIQTNTHLVIVKDGRLLRIPPDELRRETKPKDATSA